jgi:hypothetical protein
VFVLNKRTNLSSFKSLIAKDGYGTHVSKKYEEYFFKVKRYLEISQYLMKDKLSQMAKS